jgi:hypothetical protein
MSNTFAELQGMHGEDVSSLTPIINQSTGGFYTHLPGDYSGIISKMSITYKDMEGKKCKPDVAGAKPAFAGLKLIIIKDPEKQLVDSSLNIDEKDDYGRFTYNIYLALDPEKQWQNVRLLKDFTSNNIPEADVVQGKKNEEQIFLANLPLYYGCPVKWEIVVGKKEDSRYIQDILLQDHQTLTKELITKRKAIADGINAKLDAYLVKIQEERKAAKAAKEAGGAGSEAEESQAQDSTTFMDNMGGLGIPNPDASPNDTDGGPYSG